MTATPFGQGSATGLRLRKGQQLHKAAMGLATSLSRVYSVCTISLSLVRQRLGTGKRLLIVARSLLSARLLVRIRPLMKRKIL